MRRVKVLLTRLAGLVDAIDYLVYGLLFLLGFGALAYVGYVSIVG